jgi:hypothetical protein
MTNYKILTFLIFKYFKPNKRVLTEVGWNRKGIFITYCVSIYGKKGMDHDALMRALNAAEKSKIACT